ncbi:hypothetical protein OTERR_15740 [Oryzomicrobium terrae]|uniref:Acyltransferase n=1 Tax=Oryzomicrobium terrae TaxID=1735038 RepID=A0A5C1E7Z6_9RHOO|nr:acyltransferase family protein [Oryzomicrobium terrae]QEL65050.1 hypothetical protein OTERR_15740 [Oryzomicrobium terrae]
MDYRREIDGLRALAVLPVILFHAGFEAFGGGFVGVDIFFVISGYLITTIILAELEQGKFSIVNFYERRARRILPALFLVMLICIPFAWFWLLPSDMKDFSQSLVAVSGFASNILFWRESGYFGTAAELKPLLHTWSLAVEEQYYVIFPLFLMLFWKLGKRWMLVTLGLVFVASLVLAQWAAYAKPTAAFYLLPTRGWELLIGAFAAFYLSQANRKAFGKGLSEFGGWLGVALIIYAIFAYSNTTPFPGFYTLVPTLGTVLIILFATQQTTVGKFVGNKAFVGIGLISYSAYLWHQPLFAFAKHSSLTKPSSLVYGVLAVLAIVIAYFTWKYVEAPFRDKSKLTRKQVFSLSLIFSFTFVSVGLLGYLNSGNLWRFDDGVVKYFELKNDSDIYVWDLKKRLRKSSFNSEKIKILVIGDSNSGDLINVLNFVNLDEYLSISSLTIYAGCGNLYLNRSKFSHFIAADSLKDCAGVDDLLDDENKDLIRQADKVIFASSWSDWEVDLLEESYQNLISDYGDKFWFFGNKHLDFSPIDFIRLNGGASFPSSVLLSTDKAKINAKLRDLLGDRFVDPYLSFCEDEVCRLLSDSGDLLLYDGFHLSREGTIYFSSKLNNFIRLLKNER